MLLLCYAGVLTRSHFKFKISIFWDVMSCHIADKYWHCGRAHLRKQQSF